MSRAPSTAPEMVLLLRPADDQPVFHRWAVRDKRGRALPPQLSNWLPVRWSGCGRHQLDAATQAIRRDHAATIGRPCGVCFGSDDNGPWHISTLLPGVVDDLEAAVARGGGAT